MGKPEKITLRPSDQDWEIIQEILKGKPYYARKVAPAIREALDFWYENHPKEEKPK